MNSANAQVCLEVSLKKKKISCCKGEKKEKKIHIANEIFFLFGIQSAPCRVSNTQCSINAEWISAEGKYRARCS